MSSLAAYLFDSTFDEPIVWGTATVVRSIARQLGRKDLMDQPDPNITVSVYLPVEKQGALKLRWQFSGKLSALVIPGY